MHQYNVHTVVKPGNKRSKDTETLEKFCTAELNIFPPTVLSARRYITVHVHFFENVFFLVRILIKELRCWLRNHRKPPLWFPGPKSRLQVCFVSKLFHYKRQIDRSTNIFIFPLFLICALKFFDFSISSNRKRGCCE